VKGSELIEEAKQMLEESTEAIKQGNIKHYITNLIRRENKLADEISEIIAEVDYIKTLDGLELEAHIEQQMKEKK
jgi:ribosomal protein RSM22 (predicted rRNA methylase)